MAAPMPNDFVRRDEMRKALDDQLERVISYVDVALDAQRVKTVRQVAAEVSVDLDKKLTQFKSEVIDYIALKQQETLKYMAQMQRETVQEIIAAMQKPI